MHKYQKIVKIILILFTLFTVYFIVSGVIQKGKSANLATEFDADGVEMAHAIYNKENRKVIELKCSESRSVSKDKVLMKHIEALILKKGKMNKDIKVYGDDGFAENNFYNFSIEKNARIVSENFTINSKQFYLKDRAILRTKKVVKYHTESLEGIARKGMEFYIRQNVIKFFNTNGSYTKDGKTNRFKTDILWYMEPDRKLVMEKKSRIKNENSILRSNWISLTFSEDLEHLEQSSSIGNSYLFLGDRDQKDFKEIKAQNINGFYDAGGNLKKVEVLKKGRITLATESNTTRIRSELIKIYFENESEKIKNVEILLPGQVKNTGKTDFNVSADKMDLDFKDGEIEHCRGAGNCQLKIEEYRTESDAIVYDVKEKMIELKGKSTNIKSKNNLFDSRSFTVNPEKKILKSTDGVKSVINLDTENALFSKESIFINSQKIKVLNQEGIFRYQENVQLNQENTLLRADKFEMNEANDIMASGNVVLSFQDNENEIVVKGEKITFHSQKGIILIEEGGKIKSGESTLKASTLKLRFNEKNDVVKIVGEEGVLFTKEEISGSSRQVDWLFKEELVVFKDSARVEKKNGGSTTGRELKLNLKDNKILIISDEARRTETILK